MKTVEQLQTELAELEAAYLDTKKQADERGTLSYALQSANVAFSLGKIQRHDLQEAQRRLDLSVEALVRVSDLEQAVNAKREEIRFEQGRDRARFCQSVKDEFEAEHTKYREASKALLATFKTMHKLHVQYMGLVGTPLLYEDEYLLNLPACRSEHDSRAFNTGDIVRM